MLTFAYCFFFNMMLKKYWYFMGTSKFGGKYGSICGQIWVPDHDSQFAPLWTEIPLLETVGGCPNTVLSKDLNNPSQSKNKIRNWTKKTSVTGKTHNGQKKMSIRFSRYIYIVYCVNTWNILEPTWPWILNLKLLMQKTEGYPSQRVNSGVANIDLWSSETPQLSNTMSST